MEKIEVEEWQWHKGKECIFEGFLCQEGYCPWCGVPDQLLIKVEGGQKDECQT